MRIETVTPATLEPLLPLIARYQEFYGAHPDPARNREHFGRIVSDPAQGVQFAALDADGAPLGFATLYFPYSSVSARAQCLLNDLYVEPHARGRGIGRGLIERCRRYAREHGYPTLEWQTEQANTAAQALYDRSGARRTAWYSYSLPVRVE